MRTPKDIVEEYRKRGYSDEKIRIIALSRPEGLRAKILEYIGQHPFRQEESREPARQYLPLRKDDESEGGTGAVPEEEPLETEEEVPEPIEVPDEAGEPVESPLPLGSASQAHLESKELHEEADPGAKSDETVRLSDEGDEEGLGIEVRLEELRAEFDRTRRRERRLSRKVAGLSGMLKDKDDHISRLEERQQELDRVVEEGDELRQSLEEREGVNLNLETKLEAQGAKLEEMVAIHTEEMHRIIDAYEDRIKIVRARGLKANLVAFASAACVLLVFLVSLTARRGRSEAFPAPAGGLVIENDLVEEDEIGRRAAGDAVDTTDLAEMTRDPDISMWRGFDLGTGETFDASRESARSIAPEGDSRAPLSVESREAESVRYVVKKDDTLWDICQQYLGSGNKYRLVVRDNNLRSLRLKPGQVIYINLKHKN